MRIASVGQVLFAATLIAIGIMGLIKGDFAPIWEPIAKVGAEREVLVYISAWIALASGIGLLWKRTAALAAGVLLAFLLLWLLLFKVRFIFLHPTVAVVYESSGETAVIAAAGWVLYAWFGKECRHVGIAAGDKGLRLARALYGLALIGFGVSHFAYIKPTASLVPAWLPAHVVWACLTGGAYIAAGVAILFGVFARLAAALSTFQMGMFTVLVWLPVIVAGPDASQWSEFVVSWALTAGAWVVADSYHGVPWLAVRKRAAVPPTASGPSAS